MLKNKKFLDKLHANQDVSGHESPSGRITYNKVVNKRSFAIFKNIITSIVPTDIIYDEEKRDLLPSFAKVLKYKHTYPSYFYINVTMEDYMDHETEEDQERMDKLLEQVNQLPIKTPLIGLCVQLNEGALSAHASAFIVWRHTLRKYKFAFYDPLDHKRGKKSFDYAERAFVSDRFTQKIEFINLNVYCYHKDPEEFHCSQYIMNAEYCYVYSLFFLHSWIKFGSKLHRNNFRKVITATYIVDPEKLTRANNKESMIYRIVMMAFVCKTFYKYLKSLGKRAKKYITDSEKHIDHIETYLKEFKESYGFSLI